MTTRMATGRIAPDGRGTGTWERFIFLIKPGTSDASCVERGLQPRSTLVLRDDACIHDPAAEDAPGTPLSEGVKNREVIPAGFSVTQLRA